MALITIREVERTEKGFAAELVLEGRGNYPITITNPFTDREEQLLEWYFEGWLYQPLIKIYTNLFVCVAVPLTAKVLACGL